MTAKSEKKEKKAAEKPDLVEELTKKLEEAEAKAGEYLQMAQRLQADFDNFRKRTQRENEEFKAFATAGLISELLTIEDDLDRALDSAKEENDFVIGVRGIRQNLMIYQTVNTLVNVFRSIPFIILLIFLIPLTRAVVGTAINVKGAILPLVFGAVPFYTRQVEVALSGVDEGKIEAAKSVGSGTAGLILRVYLREAVPDLIRVTTVTAISLIGLTTMAGAVGAGGIGSFAINYGQNQNHPDIVNACVIILLLVTFILQSLGNLLARRTFNRTLIIRRHGRQEEMP